MSVNIVIADEHILIRRGMLFMINSMSAANTAMDNMIFNVIDDTDSPAELASLLALR